MLATAEPAVAVPRERTDPTAVDPATARQRTMAAAARQTVLRRIAPALKHDMVVHLQSLAMMAEMLNARIERGSVAAADLQPNISKLNRLAREAVMACLKVTSWIDAGDEESVALHEGVEECVALLAAGFNFRGFALASDVAPTGFEVCRHTIRNLLTASLVSLADSAPVGCEFVIEAESQGNSALLTIRSRPREQAPFAAVPAAAEAGPRPVLDWAEVQALAAAEGAHIQRIADGISLTLPRAVVTSPLQMAPV